VEKMKMKRERGEEGRGGGKKREIEGGVFHNSR
jgi:hypothetical protein